MNKRILVTLLVLSVVALGAIITSCGSQGSSPSTHGTLSYLGTQSPGDVWSWQIGPSDFIGTNETTGKYYAGTYVTLASGFNKGTVNASNDPTTPLDGSAKAYFLEVPSSVLLMQPPGGSGNVAVCAARAATAPPAGQYDWVKIPGNGWTTTDKAYGTAEGIVSSGVYSFSVQSFDIAGNFIAATLETNCTFFEGRITQEGSELQVFLTPGGIYIGDRGNSGGFAGVIHQTIDDADALSKNYRGLTFDYNTANNSDIIHPIGGSAHPTIARAMRGWKYTDVENNTIDTTDYLTITFEAQTSGILNGIITHPDGTSTRLRTAVAKIDGKYVLFGICLNPSNLPRNFIVVEQ